MNDELLNNTATLFSEIRQLVNKSKQDIAVSVNVAMTTLYWNIGKLIKQVILQNKRAEYGSQIIKNLAQKLTKEFGRGWSEKHLRHCLRFAETMPDEKIVSAVKRQLTWTHIKSIIYIEDELKRSFYIEMCKLEKWSTRTLQERINSMLYERTAISKKPEETIKKELNLLKNTQQISPDLVFKDPYFLDFLGLHNSYSEKDLESAILAELQQFIVEMGIDFAFLARQKRITIDNEDYYIDLLFYHRRLRCLVAIELKLGKFKASYKGQMELYLRWLEKYEVAAGEEKPIGLILCAGKNEEHIELLQLDTSNIKVADYLTKLPDIKLLKRKLQQSVEQVKNRLIQNEGSNSSVDEH